MATAVFAVSLTFNDALNGTLDRAVESSHDQKKKRQHQHKLFFFLLTSTTPKLSITLL
jgi:hypothetical protein